MKTAAIFVDLTETDDSVLNYMKALDDHISLEAIRLIHYLELQETTDDYSIHFPGLDKPIQEIIKEELRDKAYDAGIDEKKLEVKVHASGGQDDLLEWVGAQNFDFCVFGKKTIHKGTGIFAGKVARLINNSVLFVTENARHRWKEIVVPVDFSDYSKRTVQVASELSRMIKNELKILHVYHVSPIYFPYVKGKTETLIKEVNQKAKSKLNEFCEKYTDDHKHTMELIYAEDKTIAKCIYDYARGEHADLIIMGVKGKNDNEEFFFGSVSERLIQSDRDIPVLLVR